MSKLFFISILISTAAAVCAAQPPNSTCPQIRVIGPTGITEAGETMEFKVEIEPAYPDLTFEWNVIGGSVAAGKNTSSITVSTRREDSSVTATVRLEGLPSVCTATASENAGVALRPDCCSPSDEWQNAKPIEERARLDAFFAEMMNNPAQTGVIVLRVINHEKRDATNPRITFILKHARYRKFDVSRIVFSLEKSNVSSTILWRIPTGGEIPCDNCLLINARDIK